MTSIVDPAEFPRSAFFRAIGQIEAFCGVVVAGLATLLILCVAIYAVIAPRIDEMSNRLKVNHYTIVAMAAAGLFVAELLSFWLIFRTIQQTRGNKMLALAERHPRLPIPVRPVLFAWWAAHFVLIVLAGHYATPMIRIVEDPTEYQRWATHLIRLLFALGVSFSSNSYLMLMIASITQHRGVLRATLGLRVLTDVLLCADLLLPQRWF